MTRDTILLSSDRNSFTKNQLRGILEKYNVYRNIEHVVEHIVEHVI